MVRPSRDFVDPGLIRVGGCGHMLQLRVELSPGAYALEGQMEIYCTPSPIDQPVVGTPEPW